MYEAYRKSVYNKKFLEEHREEIQLHKAAKQAFDRLPDKKIPSRKALHEEFHQLLTEKKKAYAEYRQVKKDMQEYLIAKQTVEHILGIDKKQKEEQHKKENTRYSEFTNTFQGLFFILSSAENGQNDRVANIVDVVQWGLGLLHQQAIFQIYANG